MKSNEDRNREGAELKNVFGQHKAYMYRASHFEAPQQDGKMKKLASQLPLMERNSKRSGKG